MSYSLEDLVKDDDVQVTIKKGGIESEDDAKLRRLQEGIITILGLLTLSSLFCVCIYLILIKNNEPAFNTAIAISSGFAGYLLRSKPH